MKTKLFVSTQTVGPVNVTFIEPLVIDRGELLARIENKPVIAANGTTVDVFVVGKSNSVGQLWAKQKAEEPGRTAVVFVAEE